MNNEGNVNFFPLLNLTVSWRQDMCSDVTCPAEGAANIVEVEDNDVFEHYTAAVAICLIGSLELNPQPYYTVRQPNYLRHLIRMELTLDS